MSKGGTIHVVAFDFIVSFFMGMKTTKTTIFFTQNKNKGRLNLRFKS
jgi:hypothetical protein